jgi:glycosyltransferase involved in cell wall biosynthesis
MKIVHIINSLEIGGAENLLVNLANGQIENGHQVFVFSLFRNDFRGNIEKLDSRVTFLEFNSEKRFSFNLSRKIKNNLEKINPDVIHSHLAYPVLNLFVYYFSNLFKKEKRVHTMHGATKVEFPSVLRFIYIFFIYVLRLRIISISKAVSRDINKEYFYDSKVIYNGIPELIKKDLDTEVLEKIQIIKSKGYKKIYCNVGRINKIKNQLESVKAFSNLKGSGYALVCVGPVQDENYFKKIQEISGDNIYFLGAQDNVVNLVGEFDRFILPSISEGLGISAIEAMQAMVLVLCTNTYGLSEVVEDSISGFLIEGTNAKDIENAVLKVENISEDKLKEVIENGYVKYQNKFSLKNCLKEYEDFYKK